MIEIKVKKLEKEFEVECSVEGTFKNIRQELIAAIFSLAEDISEHSIIPKDKFIERLITDLVMIMEEYNS